MVCTTKLHLDYSVKIRGGIFFSQKERRSSKNKLELVSRHGSSEALNPNLTISCFNFFFLAEKLYMLSGGVCRKVLGFTYAECKPTRVSTSTPLKRPQAKDLLRFPEVRYDVQLWRKRQNIRALAQELQVLP